MAWGSPDVNLKGNSVKWKNWMARLTHNTCADCYEKHGKIYPINEDVLFPTHEHCQCSIVPMRTKVIGTATNEGQTGVDWHLPHYGKLPGTYISKGEAIARGWDNTKGNLAEAVPGKMIGGDIYYNREGKLPKKSGRSWKEADFDYTRGYRNNKRILYSNDGLVFVSYDHAETFYEIIVGEES